MTTIDLRRVVVVGLGAMGGGMARALLESEETCSVIGYDINQSALEDFFQVAKDARKVGNLDCPPKSMKDALLDQDVDIVVLSLVNESQCDLVAFGGTTMNDCLLQLMRKGSCVILTSTVTATWAKRAAERFLEKGILFVDSPVSGGPARSRDGDLTVMASGDDDSLEYAKPILQTLAREVYTIQGGPGAGSMVKCVHQLLAGVHICVAAEAMAMAAKAGIDVDQLYEIVNGAAGASWMFTDRGKRMLSTDPDVKSALDIFVKDLGIVFEEARKMQCPIPVASAALQQFISGQSLGLGRLDDSQVVKVYENVTRVPVKGGVTNDASVPNKKLVLSNTFLNVHRDDVGSSTSEYCGIDSDGNLTISLCDHKIIVEITRSPPTMQGSSPFDDSNLELVETFEKFVIYKYTIDATSTVGTTFPFFHLQINVTSGTIELSTPDGTSWRKNVERGEVAFKEPAAALKQTNLGDSAFEGLIVRFT